MLPKKLKIAGYNYKVRHCKNDARDENRTGWHNSNNNEIGIDPDLKEEIQQSTLLHEIIEAINYHNELKLEHPQISILETNIFQVLHDNKLIF